MNSPPRKKRADTRVAEWTDMRERHLRMWVVQMLNVSSMLDWSASWLRWFQFAFTTAGQVSSAYTSIVPVATLGCSFTSGATCAALQWSAIALSVLGSVLALMDGKYEIGSKAVRMNTASKAIGRLARRVDLQLQRSPSSREPVDEFCMAVAQEYDTIVAEIPPLPRWIRGDLTNVTLLTAYREAETVAPPTAAHALNQAAAPKEALYESVTAPPMNEHLRDKIKYELERFNEHTEN